MTLYFTRESPKHQLVFATRCYPQAWPMPSCNVCVSVCVSITFVNSVKTNKHIFKIFHQRVAKPFWFFDTKRYGNIPTGTPLTGASNAGGVGRNRDSEPISGFTAYAVKRSSGNCSKLSCDKPCRVYNTSSWWAAKFLDGIMAGNNNEVYDKKPQRYAEDNITQWLIWNL